MDNQKIKVLIIEDNQSDSIMILNAIGQSGFSIQASVIDNIDEGLELSLTQNFDCIFLDYYFPNKTGIDFLHEYFSANGKSSVIMVSNQDDVYMAVDCMKMGAVDYIAKSNLTPASISKSLRNIFNLKEANEKAAKAEKALMESELKLKRIIASSPIILFSIDQNGTFTLFKGKAAENISFKAESVVGKSIYEISGELPIKLEDYKIALKQEKLQFYVEIRGHHFEVNYIPVRGDNNKISNMMGVVIDITAFKKSEAVLKNTIEVTEAESKIKEQFLANMSHEIRTPIHGIISLTQFIIGTKPTDEQQKYLELIRKSADTLLVIVNDILDLAKMDADKMTFEETNFSLSDTLQTAVASFIPKTIEKNIEIVSEISNDIPKELLGDPVRLTQIINNLLGNAVKFTDKGKVTISLRASEKNDEYCMIEFQIQDTGIGIPKSKINTIFDSFTQAEDDTNRKFGGTGLGLSISKKLIEKQNGTIHVESEIGVGTTFTFTIPYKLDKSGNNIISEVIISKAISLKKSLRILIAEDNDINRFIIEKMITDWGAEIEFASTGREAFEKVNQEQFDIILMDVEMPDVNGYRATEMIRNEMPAPINAIPIIAMTGHAMPGEREKCIECGMNDYLSKPFKSAELKEMVAKYTNDQPIDNSELLNETFKDKAEVESKLIDLTFLRSISDNNDQFFKDFLQMFLKNTPTSIQEMKMHYANSEWENLRQAAHKVKPSFNYVGLKNLNLLTAKIEEYAKNNSNLNEIKEMLNEIEKESTIAFKEIEVELLTISTL
jgi:PAS domain S-box-containing protein